MTSQEPQVATTVLPPAIGVEICTRNGGGQHMGILTFPPEADLAEELEMRVRENAKPSKTSRKSKETFRRVLTALTRITHLTGTRGER